MTPDGVFGSKQVSRLTRAWYWLFGFKRYDSKQYEVLPAATPSWTEGNSVLLSEDLRGSVGCLNPVELALKARVEKLSTK